MPLTQDEAFLRAILEHPDDDTPRLVYADWLEERGDPRGEFIRTQCRLAARAADDGRRPPLLELERRLLERHQDEWLGPLGTLLSGWTFRRGFLDAIRVPAATYLLHATIPRPPTVRRVEVDLHGFDVPADTLGLVPESVAYENVVLPLGFRGETLVLAVQDPWDAGLLSTREFILNRGIEQVATPGRQAAEAVSRHYGPPVFPGQEPNFFGCLASPPEPPSDEVDLGSWDNGSPAAVLLSRLIGLAIGLDAREVGIEPNQDRIRVRYSCDNGVAEGEVAPIHLLWPAVTRLRILAGIWVDDPRDVQAGVFRLIIRGRHIDVGIVIRRTRDGPTVVLSFRPPTPASLPDRP